MSQATVLLTGADNIVWRRNARWTTQLTEKAKAKAKCCSVSQTTRPGCSYSIFCGSEILSSDSYNINNSWGMQFSYWHQ
jgi:hypothetical protein